MQRQVRFGEALRLLTQVQQVPNPSDGCNWTECESLKQCCLLALACNTNAALCVSGAKLGPAHLFFGCRDRKHDYIYEQELADLKAQGGCTHLHTAFSREGPTKVYVQHHIERHAEELWPLISSGGYIYVCGEAKNMAKDVHRVLMKLADRAPGGGEKFMAQLTDAGRYQKDVW